jgi:hypothetical protein
LKWGANSEAGSADWTFTFQIASSKDGGISEQEEASVAKATKKAVSGSVVETLGDDIAPQRHLPHFSQ